MARETGLEPAASAVTGQRKLNDFNGMSYFYSLYVSVRSQKYFIKGHPITSRKKAVGFATMSATEHARQRVIVTRTPAPPFRLMAWSRDSFSFISAILSRSCHRLPSRLSRRGARVAFQKTPATFV
jgi:hypothetical protein